MLKRHVKCHVIVGTDLKMSVSFKWWKFVISCVFAVFYCKLFYLFLDWAFEKRAKRWGAFNVMMNAS